MSKRLDVSVIQNRWHDGQRVDQADFDVEQNRNNQTDAAIIHNHFGSGVLPLAPEQLVLLDTDDLSADQSALVAADNFDGYGISVTSQPSNVTLGNQLEVELTGSSIFGRLSVKVAIIGLSFDDTLQMDRFYFYRNEKQVTAKHYKKVLGVFFNDFKGNNNCSRDNGGRIVIKETASFQLSRDPVMVAQDVEPDFFWRDFKVANSAVSLYSTIQSGIGSEFTVDGLDIDVTGRPHRQLLANDVVSQVGQKFLAKTDNIQKITLALGVVKDASGTVETQFDWTGDLVVSVYPLQTSVVNPSDIIPDLSIDFEPSNQPLAQLSYNQESLQDLGYVLTDVLQPVDFVFNATKLGSGSTSGITVDKYYVVTVKRSGASTNGTINVGVGNDRLEDSRVTLFSGVWVDVPEEDLWFQVWTDAAKVADGQGYDAGNGILIPKTSIDEETGAVVDHQYGQFSFVSTGENITNIGVLQAIAKETVTIQDERTGNDIFSRKQFVPSFSFVDESGLVDLKLVSEPLILGSVKDNNPKQNPELTKEQTLPGLAKNDNFCVVNPDADLLSLNLLGSKLIPNSSCCEDDFRIFKVTLCTDGYGDVNGDGYIDSNDIARAVTLVGEGLVLPTTQAKIRDGYIDTLEILRADVDGDGYVTVDDVNLITQYVNRSINSFPVGSSFTHLCLQLQQSIGRYDGYYDCNGQVRLDGYSGLNIIDPSTLSASELMYDGYAAPVIINSDSVFSEIPFPGVTYQIIPQPYWQPHLLLLSSDAKLVPASFSYPEAIVHSECSAPLSYDCEVLNTEPPTSDPGRNDFFVPDNLIIGKGEIRRPDGSNYKVDVEIGTVILQLPALAFSESALNVFEKFVVDKGEGKTAAGYAAMRYSDCTTVQPEDLALNRVRFGVSIQSFYRNLDGYSSETADDGYVLIVDDLIGCHLDHATGILKLTIANLAEDQVFKTLVSKIQIMVYLKKAGWNNQVLVVDTSEVLGLISS